MQFHFDHYSKQKFIIDKPVRLIELFAGIGSQAKAFQRLGIPFEHWRVCEFDKFAIQSYNAVHGTEFEPSDICGWSGEDLGVTDTENYIYILTYSFPCQDLSIAGKRKGMNREDKTRSGTLWEVERILKETEQLPQVLMMENVTEVHGADNRDNFSDWIVFLENLGYTNNYKDLNAKNYGIPQNRNRCFMISILGEYYYDFPEETELTECMEDRLEDEDDVPDKYYLDETQIEKLENNTYEQQTRRIHSGGGVLKTLCARDWKDPPCVKRNPSRRARELGQAQMGCGDQK